LPGVLVKPAKIEIDGPSAPATASLGSRLLDGFLSSQTESAQTWAKACGFEPSYVCHLRKGRRTPSMSMAARIDKATGGAVTVESWTQ